MKFTKASQLSLKPDGLPTNQSDVPVYHALTIQRTVRGGVKYHMCKCAVALSLATLLGPRLGSQTLGFG